MAGRDTQTLYYFVRCDHHYRIDTFLASKPRGCGDDGREFVASFINWAISFVKDPADKLEPTQVKIRDSLHDGFPEMDVEEFIRLLELYGNRYRRHGVFHSGEIKDPHSQEQCRLGTRQLFASLHTREEKAAFSAAYPQQYPLRPVGLELPRSPHQNPLVPGSVVWLNKDELRQARRTDWEHVGTAAGVAASLGSGSSGMALRTIEGGDSNMADAMEGLEMSGDGEEASARAIARAATDYMVDNDMW
ncbi:hypothetical protein LTR17_002777 [Elasticomyces elasticus]|nr:hypothetical protein LTR17_002777 [Elasticomyces elasticus]